MASNVSVERVPTREEFEQGLRNAAFAFRGYNVTNLGRTPELLAHKAYGKVVRKFLTEASETCSECTGQRVDLVRRVEEREETDLSTYHEAVSLILAVEIAQLQILRDFHRIDFSKTRLAFGFSLGEIAALVATGVVELHDAMRIPLMLAADSAELASDVQLGVLFSRGKAVDFERVRKLCLQINSEGRGVIGISSYLAPNSVLLIGQGNCLDRFKSRRKEISDDRMYLRKNENQWPPLHTPIVWQRNISDRACHMMHTLPGGFEPPNPPILSLVTGGIDYKGANTREILGRWVDHPQMLWNAVDQTLSMGIETVVHVGPQPNIFPATFNRLAANVDAQTRGSFRMRALSGIIRRPWLQTLLPRRASLLRAPLLKQITLEDWLLEVDPEE